MSTGDQWADASTSPIAVYEFMYASYHIVYWHGNKLIWFDLHCIFIIAAGMGYLGVNFLYIYLHEYLITLKHAVLMAYNLRIYLDTNKICMI